MSVNTDKYIKAHITREQRELLLRLVETRITAISIYNHQFTRDGEEEDLKALKKELEQAGS